MYDHACMWYACVTCVICMCVMCVCVQGGGRRPPPSGAGEKPLRLVPRPSLDAVGRIKTLFWPKSRKKPPDFSREERSWASSSLTKDCKKTGGYYYGLLTVTEEHRKTPSLSRVSRWGGMPWPGAMDPSPGWRTAMLPAAEPTDPAFYMIPTTPMEAVTEEPKMLHSWLGTKEGIISIKVPGCQKHCY